VEAAAGNNGRGWVDVDVGGVGAPTDIGGIIGGIL